MGQEIIPPLAIFSVLLALSSAQVNSPPAWVESTINVFVTGFSEDTEVGAELGFVLCIDPDGDPVNYRKTSGSAVQVNVNTGLVTLAVSLDFEKKDDLAYDLTFECSDVNSIGRALHPWVQTRFVITSLDANDNPPEFSVSSADGYSFFISEDSPPGTSLDPPIFIRDKDRADNSILDQLYIICNSPDPDERSNITESSKAFCEKFDISFEQNGEQENKAILRVINPLDYESRVVYSSKLIAIDGGTSATTKLTTTVNIQINVRDAQDRLPIFTNVGSSATVNEKAPLGMTILDFGVSARDGDFGDMRPVKFTIIEDTRSAFNLTPEVLTVTDEGIYEAKLIVNNQLDREAIVTAYEFVVKVTELEPGTLAETDATATATYSVFVTDSNDNAPTFSEAVYEVFVTETKSSLVTQIAGFRIVCTDPDEISNARYTVSVVSASYPIYSVTPGLEFTGTANMFLQVADTRYLDYDIEAYRTQQVVLMAREEGTAERLSGSTTIQINLRDINDNSPRFRQSSFNIQISESVSQFPYNFLNITAEDADSGANGQVTYRLEGGTENLFVIDADTGVISLEGPVNYESTPQYVFLAYATDNGPNPLQTQVQITVDVLNENDERPRFLLPLYQTSVNETQLTFLNPVNVTAVDNEDGLVRITYRIVSGQSPNNAFVINRLTGVLTLQDLLNYEETPIGDNGQFTGVFELIVEASDNGSPPQTSNVPVYINVIDVNDHEPVMNPVNYYVQLSELADPGTFVTQVMATDADSGVFGTLFYRVALGLSDNFFVNSTSGEITVGLNREFDYDVQNTYRLQVIASDGGAPQKSATATVTIEILDGNNQPPTFKELLYYIYVDESTSVNTPIETIQASDKDSSSNLEYSILVNSIRASDADGRDLNALSNFDYKNAFGVNSQGEIFVQRELSREDANQVSFTLQVRDLNTEEGNAIARTQVTIIITGDVNTDITFDQATTVFMNENARPGYNAITVTARDPSNNAVTRYRMIEPERSSKNFEVKANGRISLLTEIDYENDPQFDHLHRVVVQAISNDGSQSATVTATISIVDVNDNAPQFTVPSYETEVPETFIYPLEVLTVSATDADSRSYGPLDISISGGLDSNDFEVFQGPPNGGSQTGRRAAIIVSPNTRLDYNRRSVYNLDITVVDNVNEDFSNARLSTNAKLIIKVIDENNNSPIFVDSSRTLAVPETALLGQSIATLIATDKDVGQNGDISYSLESVGVSDSDIGLTLFTISAITGTVRVDGNLLGRGGKAYPMRVRARDKGNRPNSGYMDLVISVQSTEDDDGNPKWNRPSNGIIVTAPEETPGHVLTNDDFFDATPRTGMDIQFALSPLSDYYSSFSINNKTGRITILDDLDREEQEFYNLLVYAEDTSNPSVIRSGRQVVVQLIDEDDNIPTFTNPKNYDQCEAIDRPLTLYITENTPVGTTVYVLSACDPDDKDNSRIQYSKYFGIETCQTANQETILDLNQTTGGLYISSIVDYEQRTSYSMCVEAVEATTVTRKKRALDLSQEDPSKNNVAYINIIVVDANDNGPKFPEKELVAVVMARPSTGPVVTLAAVDPDSPVNNVINYRVTSSVFIDQNGDQQASADVFTLRGASGALYPALGSYQRFSGGRFVLNVIATDRANAQFTDDVQVVIYVYEEGQAVKLILSVRPSNAITYSADMIKELNDLSRTHSFTYLQLSEHRTDDGIESDKTDVCFLAVNEDNNRILNIREVVSLLDQQIYRNVLSQSQYNQIDRGQCYPQKSSEQDVRWRDLWWVLVAVAIFIFVCCIILIVLIVLLYDKYRRYMKTNQTYLVSQ